MKLLWAILWTYYTVSTSGHCDVMEAKTFSEWVRSTMSEPFPLRSGGLNVSYFPKIVIKIHVSFFYISHNPSWGRTGTLIWRVEGSRGILLSFSKRWRNPDPWCLVFPINQQDWAQNSQESTPLCISEEVLERLDRRRKTCPECGWFYPMGRVSGLNKKDESR